MDAEDAALDAQAQEMAEKALGALPEELRAAKLAAVKAGILKRLKAAKGGKPGGPSAPTAPRGANACPGPPPPPLQRSALPCEELEAVGSAELCGDEPWFADAALRRRLAEAVAAAHAAEKIAVAAPAEEIRRICPSAGRVLGAGAVLRLGGSHHGGYGEADIGYAYRQLSRRLHPDKNPGVPEAPDAFKRLGEAAEELKQGLAEARKALTAISTVMGVPAAPEVLERPQGALLAETLRLLVAVLGLTGEGTVPDALLRRGVDNFHSTPLGCNCTGAELLAKWYESERLLEMLSGTALRVAYDCAPKRFRAQFLSVLNRASLAEARRNESCVRGTWQAVLSQFPEICMLQEMLHKLRTRVWTPKEPKQGDGDAAEAGPGALADGSGDAVSPWAKAWRDIMLDVLPRGAEGAAPATDREVRRLAAALWRDVAEWARGPGDAQRQLELFTAEGPAPGAEAKAGLRPTWAFIPVADLLLTVGEELVGATAQGLFTEQGPPQGRRTYEGSRRARGLAPKRGLAAEPPEEERGAKRAKLNRSPTRVVLLTNLVGAGEVDEDLEEETLEEASKYGKLRKCTVKELPGEPDSETVRIFLEFEKVEDAAKAYADMNGRYFGGRVVKARFYDQQRYEKGDLGKRVTTRILLLSNLVGPEEVDEELEGETAEEARKYGRVRRCAIRKAASAPGEDAVSVFLEYECAEEAAKAFADLNGRTFGGRQVKARFCDEQELRNALS